MGKFKTGFLKHKKAYLITFFVCLGIELAIFLLMFFLNEGHSVIRALNAATLAFFIMISISGLSFVTAAGTFDSMAYGFSQWGSSMFSKKPNKYHDFNEYKQQKVAKRSSSAKAYASMLFSTIPFFVVTIVLLIVGLSLGLF